MRGRNSVRQTKNNCIFFTGFPPYGKKKRANEKEQVVQKERVSKKFEYSLGPVFGLEKSNKHMACAA